MKRGREFRLRGSDVSRSIREAPGRLVHAHFNVLAKDTAYANSSLTMATTS